MPIYGTQTTQVHSAQVAKTKSNHSSMQPKPDPQEKSISLAHQKPKIPNDLFSVSFSSISLAPCKRLLSSQNLRLPAFLFPEAHHHLLPNTTSTNFFITLLRNTESNWFTKAVLCTLQKNM